MRIVVIGCTHGQTMHHDIPDGDVLIHTGDFCAHGTFEDMMRFEVWFAKQPHKHKIFIAGNHDGALDPIYNTGLSLKTVIDERLIYLEDSSVIIDGVKFYGTPWTPEFNRWHFMKERDSAAMQAVRDAIPNDTDILISHGPPFGKLGGVCPRLNDPHLTIDVGCKMLTEAIKRVKPKYALYSHVHCGHGQYHLDDTMCVNVSTCTEEYIASNPPYIFEI